MSASRTRRAEIPPRENLVREAPFALRADADDVGDGQTLDGYGAVFNRETIIDSWEGRFRESIKPGSMKRSFRETPPIIQFDHGRHPVVGSIPIAELRSISEDVHPELAPEGGAHIIGRLLDNWLVEPVRDAIAARSITGMSFRFSVLQERWFDETGKRINDEEKLRELLRRTWFEDVPDDELLLRELTQLRVPEMGPVVWPAYSETSVGVRSKTLTIDLGRLDDPEQRKALARAVFLADAAERNTDGDPQHDTEESADEHDDPSTPDTPIDAQRATDPATTVEPADEHASDPDAQPITEQAGVHASMSERRITAELARLNGRLEAAQRHIDNSERRRVHHE